MLSKQPGVWRRYLRDAQLLACPGSDALFAPSHDVALSEHSQQVYYGPPVTTGSLAAVVGSMGLTMHFKATVADAPATCLMDSCCTDTLMSASYARRVNINIEPSVGERLRVAVADGVIHVSTGTCKVRLKLQRLSADLTCLVVELADAYETVLVRTGCASTLLLCLGGTSAVCLPWVARIPRQFLVLNVTLMNLYSLFLVHMLLQ